MKNWCVACVFVGAVVLGCATEKRASGNAEQEVRALLEQQVADWNSGNLDGFMQGYARSDSTRFASGGDVLLGWQTVFERYRRKYGDKETMGKLKFSELDIQVLGPDSAVAFGRWHLTRESTNISGLYTLIVRRTGDGWRIVHDHTSSASP